MCQGTLYSSLSTVKRPKKSMPRNSALRMRHDQRGEEAAVLAGHLAQDDGVVVLDAAQLLGEDCALVLA